MHGRKESNNVVQRVKQKVCQTSKTAIFRLSQVLEEILVLALQRSRDILFNPTRRGGIMAPPG